MRPAKMQYLKTWLAQKICFWLPIVFGCHQKPERSFFFLGKQFPICARCTGQLAGMLCGCIGAWLCQIPFQLSVMLMLPMLADGFCQMLTAYASTNCRRFLTGFLFGFGLVQIFAVSSQFAFWQGVQYGLKIAKS